MTGMKVLRVALVPAMLILGILRAWDSRVLAWGPWIVLLVSLGIALPAMALLLSLKPAFFVTALVVSLVLVLVARLASPIPLPGLFLVLLPAGMALIFAGIYKPGAAGRPSTDGKTPEEL